MPDYQAFPTTAAYREFAKASYLVDERVWDYESDRNKFDWNRVRTCGGRTVRWGGWLARPSAANFTSTFNGGVQWPFELTELDRLFDRSARWLGAREGVLTEPFARLGNSSNCIVSPKTGAVSSDNIRPFHAFDRLHDRRPPIMGSGSVKVIDKVIVKNLLCGSAGYEAVEYLDSSTGETRRLQSKAIVLCASPIETARLLLTAEMGRYGAAVDLVGKSYLDHISASYLAILPVSFSGTPIALPLERAAVIRTPANCTLESRHEFGGYTIELHGPDPISIQDDRILRAAGIERDSDRACISVNAIGELRKSPTRTLALSDRVDGIGRLQPKIEIEWDAQSRALASHMEDEIKRIATILAGQGGRVVKVRETLALGGTSASHEAGTCPMGIDPSCSVTNAFGQLHGVPGLFIGDASLMPTALDCHPTLALVGLAMNTADGVARFVRTTTFSKSIKISR
ncbi:GMC oxidoreductase [Burkholderia glumae]|uniref:GMC oxidoreductase n=1 Tax=Burkholderia glumae TaxID=337 RepID=UPI001F52A562|nr:GMC oxidoreductase [Burkholderia glumae]